MFNSVYLTALAGGIAMLELPHWLVGYKCLSLNYNWWELYKTCPVLSLLLSHNTAILSCPVIIAVQ